MSNNIRSQVRDFHVIEDIVPSSDHWPVRLLIQLDDGQHNVKISNVRQNHLVCNWQQCQDLDLLRYQWELDRRLSDIEIPWDAILCNQPDRCCHKPLLEPYCESIIYVLHTAGQNSIRLRQREASEAYWKWKQSGKCRSGTLFVEMRDRRIFRKELES